jgi:hypothetical protein
MTNGIDHYGVYDATRDRVYAAQSHVDFLARTGADKAARVAARNALCAAVADQTDALYALEDAKGTDYRFP